MDYAIVVGVTAYPKLMLDGKRADLAGPINDAEAIRAWLRKDSGGGVPADNIEFVVRDTGTKESVADPTRDAIVEAFARMWGRFFKDNGAPRFGLGRRLYVYVSGHGLASSLDHGVLLCSNSSNAVYTTVGPHLAINPFRQSGFFKQFVIWFDGCMDFVSMDPEPINYNPRPVNSLDPPGPVFTAYAAPPRLKTVETKDAEGKMRGVFTRTLIEGLGGAAADPETKQIDGKSLRKYLFNAMPKYLPPTAWDNKLIAKQPFVDADDGIVFSEATVIPQSAIVFQIGQEFDGATARLWGNGAGAAGLTQLDTQQIIGGKVTFTLASGFYVIDVPQHNLRTGFEVTGSMATKLF